MRRFVCMRREGSAVHAATHPRARGRASNLRDCLFALLLGLLHGLSSAQAEDAASAVTSSDGAAEALYARSIDEALVEYERGNFEEAREHMRAAHDVFPNARTLRGLGKVEFELRNYGESVKLLEAAMASQVKPLDDTLRVEVEQILARARAYVGEVHVNVEPGSATVSVDGVAVASGPNAALALVVGDHVLEFRASGHLPERRAIRVKGGESITVRVVLPSPAEPGARLVVENALGAHDTRLDEKPVYKRWWVWTTVGAVIAGGVLAGVLIARSGSDEGHTNGGTTGVVLKNP
jgi:hypothetical protein